MDRCVPGASWGVSGDENAGVELMAESKEGVRGWRLIMRSDGSGRADPADVFMVGVGV